YPYPYMVYDVERAIRFLRHNASRWDGQANRIALVGGSAGGFLSNMVGLLNLPGDPSAADAVDRESAQAQAVVTLFAQSSFATVPLNADVHAARAREGRQVQLQNSTSRHFSSRAVMIRRTCAGGMTSGCADR
ncbi:MAG: alpha/beta hydrolase fold domain-containing protein, partial [Verrucomicrobiota bacterium]